MADINVKNQSSTQNQEGSRSALERSQQGEGALSRSRGWDPFGSFFMNPAEFFSANPFTMMRRMSEEMDRTFGRMLSEGGAGTRGNWLPAIEISEREGQLHVHAELPGIKPEDVKVEIDNDRLVIQGERRSQQESGTGQAYRSERRYGQFYREILLPEGVNAEQARAQFRDGMLEISIPVPQQAGRRREIPVSTTGTASASAIGTGTTQSAAAGAGTGSTSEKTGSSTK
ncbi:MAG: Hsp20/alpha crystallin family protein [Acidobacteriaceae bacterium]|nr:Hsp20/alpha crystallin family protein [Acidobacteriaceae bacterium]